MAEGDGFKKLLEFANSASDKVGKVGWPSSATYEDGTKVADVAEYQELGTAHIPPRPFIRPTMAEKQNQWLQSMGEGLSACMNGTATVDQVLEMTALLAAGDIAQAIQQVNAPPLKEATVKAKGFAKPLINTGHMFQTLTGAVEAKD